MYRDAILVAGAANQKSNAAFKREALALRLLKILLDLVEYCGLELLVGAQWQIKNCNDGIVPRVLKPGKTRAGAHTHRGLQANPQAGRENRVGDGARREACQGGPGQ